MSLSLSGQLKIYLGVGWMKYQECCDFLKHGILDTLYGSKGKCWCLLTELTINNPLSAPQPPHHEDAEDWRTWSTMAKRWPIRSCQVDQGIGEKSYEESMTILVSWRTMVLPKTAGA